MGVLSGARMNHVARDGEGVVDQTVHGAPVTPGHAVHELGPDLEGALYAIRLDRFDLDAEESGEGSTVHVHHGIYALPGILGHSHEDLVPVHAAP